MSVATIGGKIISTANENGNGHTLPAYEFVLIQDTTYATGSRFLVWLFNKVTGNASKKDDDKKEDSSGSQTTRSLNTIRAVALENGNVAFECNASLGVQIQFPSIVMKMIPDGKEKSEKIGSESLKKALEDDVPTALEGFLETYLQWLES